MIGLGTNDEAGWLGRWRGSLWSTHSNEQRRLYSWWMVTDEQSTEEVRSGEQHTPTNEAEQRAQRKSATTKWDRTESHLSRKDITMGRGHQVSGRDHENDCGGWCVKWKRNPNDTLLLLWIWYEWQNKNDWTVNYESNMTKSNRIVSIETVNGTAVEVELIHCLNWFYVFFYVYFFFVRLIKWKKK